MTGAPLRVVVVTSSPGDSLESFLASLDTILEHEVVLAEEARTDSPTRAVVGPRVRLLETGGDVGFGRAANLGASGAGGDWLLFASPDVVLAPGALDELVAAAGRRPRAGCLGPAVRTTDGRLLPSARAFPSLGHVTGQALSGRWWSGGPGSRSSRDETVGTVEGTTGWLAGPCLLLRREAFEMVGGFDPTYGSCCEDMDLCRRLADAGWQNVSVPSAVITLEDAHASSRPTGPALREHHRALYRFLSRQHPGPARAPARALLAVGLTLRLLRAARVRSVGVGAERTRSSDVLATHRSAAGS